MNHAVNEWSHECIKWKKINDLSECSIVASSLNSFGKRELCRSHLSNIKT